MTKKRRKHDDWARLHARWYRDGVLREAAAVQPAVMTLWPILIGWSKAESSDDKNPSGVIATNRRDLAHEAFLPDEVVDEVLELLVQGEFITITEGRFKGLRIELVKFTEWQTPRGSTREENERREASRAGKKQPEHTTTTRPAHEKHTLDIDGDVDKGNGAAPATADALPPSVQRTIDQVRPLIGHTPRQLASNVRKAMEQFPSLDDAAVCEAITAFEARCPEGRSLPAPKAWAMLRNCFEVARRRSTEQQTIADAGRSSKLGPPVDTYAERGVA